MKDIAPFWMEPFWAAVLIQFSQWFIIPYGIVYGWIWWVLFWWVYVLLIFFVFGLGFIGLLAGGGDE